MGKPTAPEQIQTIAKEIGESPIQKYPKEQQQQQQQGEYSKQPPSDAYRQRNTRSQGDYIGLLPPEIPTIKKTEERKVKISPQVKVRTGSHESMRVPPNDGQTVRSALNGKNGSSSSKFGNVRKLHAGEAAGGLLMMRQKEEKSSNIQPTPTASTSNGGGKRSMANAFKFRS